MKSGTIPAAETGKVGYANPPMHTRSRKGLSGNPPGRPRGARDLSTDMNGELDSHLLVLL